MPGAAGSTRWLVWSHRGAFLLLLATFFAYGRWRLSWRGQGMEAILFGWTWLSAAWLVVGRRRQLPRRARWYFGLATLFPFLPLVGWLPAAYALLPNRVVYENQRFALRDQNKGFLDGRRLARTELVAGVFERLVAYSDDWPQRISRLHPPSAAAPLPPTDSEQMPSSANPDSVVFGPPGPGGRQTALLYLGDTAYETDFSPTRHE